MCAHEQAPGCKELVEWNAHKGETKLVMKTNTTNSITVAEIIGIVRVATDVTFAQIFELSEVLDKSITRSYYTFKKGREFGPMLDLDSTYMELKLTLTNSHDAIDS